MGRKFFVGVMLLAAPLRMPASPVAHISAFYRDGQVFITWDNNSMAGVIYTAYRSVEPIQYGYQLPSAENLGFVRDNSALDQRLTELSGGTPNYLRIDSASTPLTGDKGLFVATSTMTGSFYYAVTTTSAGVEDSVIVLGSNSLSVPVSEIVATPNPIWQKDVLLGSRTYQIYVQFATKVTSSIYPLMTNAGSYPFHFALIKSGLVTPHPVSFRMHGDTKSLFPGPDMPGIGEPNEWIVSIDDWLPDQSGSTTCYYGYHENYDIYSSANPVPTSGTLYDYTFARVKHTIDWALRNLPVDSTRVYLTGVSAGAIGALFAGLMIPSKFAAIAAFAPQCDMATTVYPTDNQHWGTPQSNLMTNDGYRRNERLNANFLARIDHLISLPVIYTFCGKNDQAVGWAEKPPFYDTLNLFRHGGFHFWSMTTHEQAYSSPWQANFPNFSFFTRYRTNLSYPAFSNCSINDNPGNGLPSNGAAQGTVNGHLDWTDNILDAADKWEITLRLKDLSTTLGPDIAPDSATVDVTLRRLQAFNVPPSSIVDWESRRNGVVVQHGSFLYDSGLVTIPGVRVYKDTIRLAVGYGSNSIAENSSIPGEFRLLQNFPNPFNPTTAVRYQVPVVSNVKLAVYDILGREVSVLVNEKKNAGSYEVKFDGSNLASGVYFCRLQAGDPSTNSGQVFTQTKRLLLMK